MRDLVWITAQFFFRVQNSAMYGGSGTTGYAATKLEGVENVEKLADPVTIQGQIKAVANMLKVSPDEVELISKADYDLATEGPDDDEDCLDDEEDWDE